MKKFILGVAFIMTATMAFGKNAKFGMTDIVKSNFAIKSDTLEVKIPARVVIKTITLDEALRGALPSIRLRSNDESNIDIIEKNGKIVISTKNKFDDVNVDNETVIIVTTDSRDFKVTTPKGFSISKKA